MTGSAVDVDASERARVMAAVGRLAPVREEFPFTPRFFEVPGGRMHYVDEGRGEPVVCVHGNPTWSFAFRRVVKAFSGERRVVAMDHLGCGLSEKPQAWDYRLEDHAENLTRLVAGLGLERITLVVHDWGGAIGMGMARRVPERIARVLVLNSAAFPGKMPLRIRAARMRGVGPYLVKEWNAFALMATRMALHRPKRLSAAARSGMLLPYVVKESRVAIERFVADIPMDAGHRSWGELARTAEGLAMFANRPVAICWGERDWCFTSEFREAWERRFPRAAVTKCADAGHWVFEEAPGEVERALRALLAVPVP